jgi:hypothetical protein
VKKVAIFVEGLTEQEFVVSLVSAIVGQRGLHVILGRQWKNKVIITPTAAPKGVIEFKVMVVDCANDEQVKTQIREQYPTLVAAGYTAIIGVRDVYPAPRVSLPRIQGKLSSGLPVAPILPTMHLAVMEVEAWFMDEVTHFARIHATLTVPHVVANGFDIVSNRGDTWNHPADVLDKIYRLAGLRYLTSSGAKTKRRIKRTVDAIDFDEIYVTVRNRLPDLNSFLSSIEAALF